MAEAADRRRLLLGRNLVNNPGYQGMDKGMIGVSNIDAAYPRVYANLIDRSAKETRNGGLIMLRIDADAHVLETEKTWE
ncbi:MAG: hypothetical protein ACREQV_06005, partial [Candidatus Binatia bacterium]